MLEIDRPSCRCLNLIKIAKSQTLRKQGTESNGSLKTKTAELPKDLIYRYVRFFYLVYRYSPGNLAARRTSQ